MSPFLQECSEMFYVPEGKRCWRTWASFIPEEKENSGTRPLPEWMSIWSPRWMSIWNYPWMNQRMPSMSSKTWKVIRWTSYVGGVYHPIKAALPSNPTPRRSHLVQDGRLWVSHRLWTGRGQGNVKRFLNKTRFWGRCGIIPYKEFGHGSV